MSDSIRPLVELLRAHAERLGGKIAFDDGPVSVSYAELERRTARLGGHLAGRVDRGARVILLLGNSVRLVEGYLAVLRAAAVAVPVNPRSADDELAYLVADSGATLVITDRNHVGQVNAVAPDIPVLTDADLARLGDVVPDQPARDDLGLDEVAWLLYTSGTTGSPKGVLSTQRSCLWSVANSYAGVLGLNTNDRLLWPLPLFHSFAHIVCVLGVTAVGASARIMNGFSAAEVLAAMRAEDFTFLAGVPAMYHHILAGADDGDLGTGRLRVCVSTGAGASAELRAEFAARFGVRLVDSYGSTETCGAITATTPDREWPVGSCGAAVPGVSVRLVDPKTGEEGTEGEVWVSGPNLMLGYHGKPEETAKAVVDGWYRTGDIAGVDGAGNYTIRGRVKELIIRGGENIHPGEIESVVAGVPGIVDVVAAGKPDDVLGEVPVVYVVGTGIDPDAVFAACRAALSYFKVPTEIHQVAEIPRTASGKAVRHRLASIGSTVLGARDVRHDGLFRPDWVPVPVTGGGAEVVLAADPDAALADPNDTVYLGLRANGDADAVVERTARLVDGWLARPAGRLVVVTTGALAVLGVEPVAAPVTAAAWGVLRPALQAHPDRFALVDLDDDSASRAVLAAAVASGEPYLGIRAGLVRALRLEPLRTNRTSAPDLSGTVLLTGAG
ncbi:AMP-binding protein, partial [Actinophytocola sp.]|uniref:AMP-binding protein n=1 Tax=Actinophytocola sp. TaxID=1872138 RepID=UPI00389A0639